jgi:peroxiredoxin
MTPLNPGDRFPDIELTRPGGETLQVLDALAGGYGVVLFYRGTWSPWSVSVDGHNATGRVASFVTA